MRILGLKPGHDGTVVCLEGDRLALSLEAEKDNFPRYSVLTPTALVEALNLVEGVPDVIAINGYVQGLHDGAPAVEAGYLGIDPGTIRVREQRFLGRPVTVFSSPHERSHVMCAYGLSPFAAGRPCYCLVWEGILGAFYEIDAELGIRRIGTPLANPGTVYSLFYAIADPTAPLQKGFLRYSNAGKLMALAAHSDHGPMSDAERSFFDDVVRAASTTANVSKTSFADSPYYDIGVEHPAFTGFAGKASDRLFEIFAGFAAEHCDRGWPLLIAGGCGLNCDWNTRWRRLGLFEDVFVPPVANDSGAALGTAIDAKWFLSGDAKVEWNVYAGQAFVEDDADLSAFEPAAMADVAAALEEGDVVAWVQGQCEMGPRALGNRSILAAPFERAMTDRLNRIKQREGFRPVAPVCRLEDAGAHFEPADPSPHMLYFQRVTDARLRAVTHVDGTARAQTVTRAENPALHALLTAFKRRTGCGVLCNTSLNFSGTGFINRTSDLVRFVLERDLDGFVIGDRFYRRERAA